MRIQTQEIQQQKLTRKAVECEIERLEYLLNNYKVSAPERQKIESYLKNAKHKMQEYSTTKEIKQAR